MNKYGNLRPKKSTYTLENMLVDTTTGTNTRPLKTLKNQFFFFILIIRYMVFSYLGSNIRLFFVFAGQIKNTLQNVQFRRMTHSTKSVNHLPGRT